MDEGTKENRSRKEERHAWGISYVRFGVIGLVIVVPALIGAMLGMWLDLVNPGSYSWTLVLILVGLALGLVISASWIKKEVNYARRI